MESGTCHAPRLGAKSGEILACIKVFARERDEAVRRIWSLPAGISKLEQGQEKAALHASAMTDQVIHFKNEMDFRSTEEIDTVFGWDSLKMELNSI